MFKVLWGGGTGAGVWRKFIIQKKRFVSLFDFFFLFLSFFKKEKKKKLKTKFFKLC